MGEKGGGGEMCIRDRSIGAVVQGPLNIVLSLKDKNINSPSDLVGKTIGYAGTELSEAIVRSIMENVGADYSLSLIHILEGVKRGLFSNEAGSGSAPCAAAAAECDSPAKMGLVQALGVFIDTLVICSCTAMIMLLVPEDMTSGLVGMNLLQTAMEYHLGKFGVVFIAATLAMFSFSTFLGILFYARSNVAYLFGDKWIWPVSYTHLR